MLVPRFKVGDLVHHRLVGYRGVIVEVHDTFQASDEWYGRMAQSRPPRDAPWYCVLPHGRDYQTYVADRNLEPDRLREEIDHPSLRFYFRVFHGDRYSIGGLVN